MRPFQLSALFVALAVSQHVSACADHHVYARHVELIKRQNPPNPPTPPNPAPPNPAAPTPPASNNPYGVPPLESISAGMPERPPATLATTYTPGSVATDLPKAPPLPATFQFSADKWPLLDKIPPTDTPEVQEWLKELEGKNIPNFRPSKDGSCGGDPEATAESQERVWWTCGHWESPLDVYHCPDKMTWGVSFDDGPAPHTPDLLKFLDDKKLAATFFAVGSRVVSFPATLISEYMSGHDIAVHTWSHHSLTSMTNEQIVAELGWSRKAIKDVLGVTPLYWRAPFGDIDERVRSIAMSMNLQHVGWTIGPGGPFDTNDWHVAGGEVTSTEQARIFRDILTNATHMDTGIVVLQHDLFPVTVDLAIVSTIDTALKFEPPFTLRSLSQCLKVDRGEFYLETRATSNPLPRTKIAAGNGLAGSSAGNGNKTNDNAPTPPGTGAGSRSTASHVAAGVAAVAVAAAALL